MEYYVCILVQEGKKTARQEKGDDKANVLKCLQLCTVLATLLSLIILQNRKLTQKKRPTRDFHSEPTAAYHSPQGRPAAEGKSL